jgi:hypothetical protein
MRTTLTIDDDIVLKLKNEVSIAVDKSFKDVVNETLRRGLLAKEKIGEPARFRVRGRKMGLREGMNYDNIGELLEQIEDAPR